MALTFSHTRIKHGTTKTSLCRGVSCCETPLSSFILVTWHARPRPETMAPVDLTKGDGSGLLAIDWGALGVRGP